MNEVAMTEHPSQDEHPLTDQVSPSFPETDSATDQAEPVPCPNKLFTSLHAEVTHHTKTLIEALGRRVATMASCLAVGDPTAMLRPEAWQGEEYRYSSNGNSVSLKGDELERARKRWRLWYRFFTAMNHSQVSFTRHTSKLGFAQLCRFYQDAWLQVERPRRNAWCNRHGALPERTDLKAMKSEELRRECLREHDRRDQFEASRNGDQLPELSPELVTSLLLGLATSVRNDSPEFLCWSIVHTERAEGRPALRIGSDLRPLLAKLRRWDPSGTKSRKLALAQG